MFKALSYTLLLSLPLSTKAASEDFTKGPVFKHYGENSLIRNGLDNAEIQQFKVVFDISKQSDMGMLNRHFNSVARFINMHVRAGVSKENISAAMVIHCKASFDLLNNNAHTKKFSTRNSNTELINLLSEYGVKIFICGQSASYHGSAKAELNENVTMSLSAMTANALLQQQGYTLNPF